MLAFPVFTLSYSASANEKESILWNNAPSSINREKVHKKNTNKNIELSQQLFLTEYTKQSNWEDLQANAEMGVPLPSYIGEKFTKVSYKPSFKFETPTKKHIFFGELEASQIKTSDAQYSSLESLYFSYQKRIEYFIPQIWSLYLGGEINHIKKYTMNSEDNFFQHYTRTGIFASNKIYIDVSGFKQFYLQLDAGERRDMFLNEAYTRLYISKLIHDNLFLVGEGELSVIFQETFKRKIINNFDRYGIWNVKIGVKVFEGKGTSFTFLFTNESNKRYGFTASGIVFSYNKKI